MIRDIFTRINSYNFFLESWKVLASILKPFGCFWIHSHWNFSIPNPWLQR